MNAAAAKRCGAVARSAGGVAPDANAPPRYTAHMSRWDRILEQKPQELKDYVLDRVAEQLAKDLRDFPPPIEEWLDEAVKARYAQVMARVARPELDTYR